jgi:hypothetical protein
MPSESFMRNNQNYRQAGDWRFDRDSRYTGDWRFDRDSRYTGDGYRRSDGQKKIMGYSQKQGGRRMGEPSTQPSSLNEFFYRQEGYSPKQSRTLSRQLAERGYTKGFGGQGIEPNRGMSDRERAQTGPAQTGGGKGGFKRFRGPTDDQRKWSRKFQESQTPITTSTGAASPTGIAAFDNVQPQVSTATRGPAPAPNFSRSALVQGAKKSGDFARVRDQYNTAAVGTGNRMDAKTGAITPLSKQASGPDGTSAFARDKFGAAAEDIRARRDFARGEAPVQRTSTGTKDDPWASTATKLNPYGTATATFGGPARTSGGTMADPLTGKTVPMKEYLPQQSAVQGTKEPGNTSGESYYDPKKIRSSMQKGKA